LLSLSHSSKAARHKASRLSRQPGSAGLDCALQPAIGQLIILSLTLYGRIQK
jgi:hypothetical protein